ncbi:hypothetical protein [Caldalkalibacillus salinus]|uniref:hypothetical protein n=1 Tax=Caldalkalibacillus salinus TaxID=2803787 RepID=UPI001921C3E8|nr:hypothetical protein [Caldalkalibacillus salinus]
MRRILIILSSAMILAACTHNSSEDETKVRGSSSNPSITKKTEESNQLSNKEYIVTESGLMYSYVVDNTPYNELLDSIKPSYDKELQNLNSIIKTLPSDKKDKIKTYIKNSAYGGYYLVVPKAIYSKDSVESSKSYVSAGFGGRAYFLSEKEFNKTLENKGTWVNLIDDLEEKMNMLDNITSLTNNEKMHTYINETIKLLKHASVNKSYADYYLATQRCIMLDYYINGTFPAP